MKWRKADSIKRYAKYHSNSTGDVPVLLANKRFNSHAVIGWYLAGHLHQWRIDGSPSVQFPTHWMPLPKLP